MSSLVEQSVGRMLTPLTITNRTDQVLCARGLISESEVRSISIEDASVDISVSRLYAPSALIAELGLELLKEVDVATASGIGKVRIFQDAKLTLCGREGTFECIELPNSSHVLIGSIPLDSLGIKPDLKNQKLKVLPSESADTYLTIL